MRAITVCVEYDDYLAITLPQNRKLFDEYLIVTSRHDTNTKQLALANDCKVLVTDAFYQNGAMFNKGLAIERAFDLIGRQGWLTILDADIVLPKNFSEFKGESEYLYSPHRCVLHDVRDYVPGESIGVMRVRDDIEFAGYCQIFNAASSYIKNKRPWYGINWQHAGGCDSYFQNHWPMDRKIRPDWNVLHLGKPEKNWAGRWTERIDGTPASPDARVRRENMFLKVREPWGDRIIK